MKKIKFSILLFLLILLSTQNLLSENIYKRLNAINLHDLFKSTDFFQDRKDKIKYIINHYTAINDLDRVLMVFQISKNSVHFIIDNNGKIFQVIPSSKKAYHTGVSSFNSDFDLNENSIGIEHVNFGFLEYKNQIIRSGISKSKDICIIFNEYDKTFVDKCSNIKKIFLKNKRDGLV